MFADYGSIELCVGRFSVVGSELDRLQVGVLLWRAWALTEECLLVEFVSGGLDTDSDSEVADEEDARDHDGNQVCLQQFLISVSLFYQANFSYHPCPPGPYFFA